MGDNAAVDFPAALGKPKKNVVVTGFNKFATHEINASAVTVDLLQKDFDLGPEYNLITTKLDVIYDTVDQRVPKLWKEHQPHLMVHCGVSGIAKELTLEQYAHRNGYGTKDTEGCIPCQQCCSREGSDILCTGLQLGKVCEAVNKSSCGVKAVVSRDAGRYLCDYIYYTSLNINSSCTVFVHVPPLNKPYSAEQLAKALHIAVLAMLKQLEEPSSSCPPEIN